MSIGTKLDYLLKKNGRNANEVAEALGVNPQTLYAILKRNNTKTDINLLRKLASEFSVALEYFCDSAGDLSEDDENGIIDSYNRLDKRDREIVDLILNKGANGASNAVGVSKSISASNASGISAFNAKEIKISNSGDEKMREIPLYDLPASAGTGSPLENSYYELIKIPMSPPAEAATYAIRVSGDSMEPEYFDGEIALVKHQRFLNDGDIGIFTLNGEGFIKKYSKRGLISLNKKYPLIKIRTGDDCRINGKVVGKIISA
jgi:SOS-response transcriptional repressor LexA